MAWADRIFAFNRAPLWRSRTRVWGLEMTPPTLDRWIYLRLHRWGWMGGAEKAFLERTLRPGMSVADVGANIGLYASLMARLVGAQGRVYAFEPEPLMAEALRRNLAANGAAQAEVFACAVGSAAGTIGLRRDPFNSGDSRPSAAPPSAGEAVPICALQEALDGRRVDLVKIDVQGWEEQVLRGLGGLLRVNPALAVYFEFCPEALSAAGTPPAALQSTLDHLGLKVLPLREGTNGAAVDLEALAVQLGPRGYVNLLARRP